MTSQLSPNTSDGLAAGGPAAGAFARGLRELAVLLRAFVRAAPPGHGVSGSSDAHLGVGVGGRDAAPPWRDAVDPLDDGGGGAEGASTAALALGLARRALDRLDRDLCPRTAGEHEHLVVGIVGPNNAGKSALFNALVANGRVGAGALSPSRATGGATRRLVGAVHPALRRRLEREPTLARFPMRGVTPTAEGVTEALEEAEVPEELLLVETALVPEGLLLVDTPDFDSVLRTNREVASALLCVADVAVAVVTRHTYQNRDVVAFLGEWLAHERPWVLVYNEAFDDEVTLRHAEALAAGVGAPPVAVFAAPHSIEVARGEAPLTPRGLARLGDSALEQAAVDGRALGDWLRDQGEATALKARALRASVAQLHADLTDLVGLLDEDGARTGTVLALVDERARSLGRDVARATMPTAEFLDAFRRVLDRRPTALQQKLRGGLRWTGQQLESGARWVRRRLGSAGSDAPRLARTRAAAEGAALAAHWTQFHADVVRSLRPAREAARPGTPGGERDLFDALASDLAAPASEGLARATAAVSSEQLARDGQQETADELADFGRTCERLIEAELDRGGIEWALQIGVDALHLLPAVAAGAVILHTGGLGADLAVAGGGALSAVLAERLSRLLGSGVAREARENWALQRGGALAAVACDAVLPATAPLLRRRKGTALSLARALDTWLRHAPRTATVNPPQHAAPHAGERDPEPNPSARSAPVRQDPAE
ncbi:MAG: GTPase [Planctomycetota bacterium]